MEATLINVALQAPENETVTKVLLWSHDTFQNRSLAIDLTHLLNQTSNIEEFVVSPSDAEVSNFRGLFFIEVMTSNQECTNCGLVAVAGNLTSYYSFLLEEVLNYSVCTTGECGEEGDILNISILLESINISLKNGYFNEAIDLMRALDRLTSDCDDCAPIEVYCSMNTGLNFGTLNNTLILG